MQEIEEAQLVQLTRAEAHGLQLLVDPFKNVVWSHERQIDALEHVKQFVKLVTQGTQALLLRYEAVVQTRQTVELEHWVQFVSEV